MFFPPQNEDESLGMNQNNRPVSYKPRDDRFKVCRDFLTGSCKRGSSCKFRHERHPSSYVPLQNFRSDRRYFPYSDGRPEGRSINSRRFPFRKVCFLFKSGHCTYKQCKFLHESPDADAENMLKAYKEVPPCRDYQRGCCTFGSLCKYRHEPIQESVSPGSYYDRMDNDDHLSDRLQSSDSFDYYSNSTSEYDHVNNTRSWEDSGYSGEQYEPDRRDVSSNSRQRM